MRVAVVVALFAGVVNGEEWPGWRGPNRNDITSEKSGWGSGGWRLKRIWSKSVGAGGTSVVVGGKGRLYTMGWISGKDYVYCLDAATGKEIWKKEYKCRPYGRYARGDQGWYKGVTSTPEYDGQTGLLYTLSTDGDLYCRRGQNGEKVWHINLYDKYKVKRRPGNRDYGYTSSPLIQGELLIVEVGDDEGNLMAFEKRSGKRRWASQCNDPAGHNSGPMPMTVQGVPCIAVFTCASLLVVRTDKGHEGKTVARYGWVTDYNNNIASAAVSGNKVLVTSGYNQNRMCMFEITLKGISKRYEVKGDYSKVCTPVIYNNHIYIAYNQLRCYEIDKDGLKLRWTGSRDKFDFGTEGSCLITGDRRLIAFGSRGGRRRLGLVDIGEGSGDKCKLLASNEDVFAGVKSGRGRAWPHVVLAEGRIYCKDSDGNIVCFSVGK